VWQKENYSGQPFFEECPAVPRSEHFKLKFGNNLCPILINIQPHQLCTIKLKHKSTQKIFTMFVLILKHSLVLLLVSLALLLLFAT
jgi:hypothetical protein